MRAHEAGALHAEVGHGGPAWLGTPADVNALMPQLWPRTVTRGPAGALTVGGRDVRDLAAEFGTPVYLLDEADFRARCRDFAEAFGDAELYYAGKAFLCKAVVRMIAEEGLSLDVCSGGELAVALAAGMPPERIGLHGNNKSPEELPELDLGGGFGIAYTSQDDPRSPAELADGLRRIVKEDCDALGLAVPRLSVEPGRAIAGPAMFTLYQVGTVKDVDGIRTYVSVDGGMSDNIRAALYDASYSATLASRAAAGPPILARVVGKHCEAGDIVVKDEFLPADVQPGDLLAVPGTGAYCRSMASNYNHVPRPPVVAVRDGAARVLIRRETEADLLALDVG